MPLCVCEHEHVTLMHVSVVLQVCMIYVWDIHVFTMYVCHGTHVEIRRQLCGVCSLYLLVG